MTPPTRALRPKAETRPWVDAFADEMEAKLAENRHKGDRNGWVGESAEWLLGRLKEEVAELESAVSEPVPDCGCREVDCPHIGTSFRRADRLARIIREAADVGNFAMMIADVAGHMKPRRGPMTRRAEVEQEGLKRLQ